jgi:hypothetical protein
LKENDMKNWLAALALATAAGCAAPPPLPVVPAVTTAVPAPSPPPPVTAPAQPAAAAAARYRCDRGIEFTVRFADDSAFIESSNGGSEVALRDAGGVTPQQSVYSNAHLRAEFGLGAQGREAKLQYPPDPRVAHCALQ